jgi:hypothetical protein
MKNIIIGIAIIAISAAACNNGSNGSSQENNKKKSDTTQEDNTGVKAPQLSNDSGTKGTPSIKEIISGYLQLKNALANDNGNDAATGGKAILDAVAKFDKSSLSAVQKKTYEDVADDIKENAEHISENSSKIAHQREHFDMLSTDMYDLAKAFDAGQTLYKDYCPMYNDKKGAIWLSEVKEIKNPYLGNKMPTCEEVKEEIK